MSPTPSTRDRRRASGTLRWSGQDPGLTEKDFRKKGKLKRKSKVNRDTTSNALTNLRAVYQKKDRLEGTITLRSRRTSRRKKRGL